MSKLNEGSYTRSRELQNIFTKIKEDKEYKIFLHFYVTNDLNHKDLQSIITQRNLQGVFTEIFFLKDIKEKYYGKSYTANSTLKTKLRVKNKATYLAIRPEQYVFAKHV